MLKNKLYQYFASEFFKNFILILFSLSLIMLLTQAAKFLNLITEMGNSSLTYIKYVLLNFPRVVEKTIPFAFLISFFFTISKLKNDKELNIFWYSGISHYKIFKVTLSLTFVIFIFYLFLAIFAAPYSLSSARNIIANSEFTLINSLVKEKNFNSPLKDLTIYVDDNNKKGNLKKVFIFEEERTISAKYAKVIKKNNIIFLELEDGISLEKNNSSLNTIKFEKLIFDFSKFKTKNLKIEKFSERNIFWLINALNIKKIDSQNIKQDEYVPEGKKKDLIYEINKRLIKPFFIFFLCVFSTYILYENKVSKSKFKKEYYIFLLCFFSLVLNEIFLGYSSKSLTSSIAYFFLIFLTSLTFYLKHHKLKKYND